MKKVIDQLFKKYNTEVNIIHMINESIEDHNALEDLFSWHYTGDEDFWNETYEDGHTDESIEELQNMKRLALKKYVITDKTGIFLYNRYKKGEYSLTNSNIIAAANDCKKLTSAFTFDHTHQGQVWWYDVRKNGHTPESLHVVMCMLLYLNSYLPVDY